MADKSLTEEIESDDARRQLVALRDYVAHELEGNRCKTCEMSKLRTGDTAALVLRLQKIIEDLRELPTGSNKEVSELDAIRNRRNRADRQSASEDHVTSNVGVRSQTGRSTRRPPS